MELTFVDDAVVEEVRSGRPEKYPWKETIETIKKNPGKWALLPFELNNPASAYHHSKKPENKGIEVVCKGGNNLPAGHPDKKKFKIYLRFTPPEN